MALVIKSLFGMFWVFSSSFLVYLMYIVMQTESDPRLRWAWLVMSGLTFMAATLLAYIVISARTVSSSAVNSANDEITANASVNPSEIENDIKNTD
ncbi:MAG: hypothetical protein L6420_10365 [Elusimicrobia bacterium]|nr:hypothetical protein [Elusimicrobiota bacterium]